MSQYWDSAAKSMCYQHQMKQREQQCQCKSPFFHFQIKEKRTYCSIRGTSSHSEDKLDVRAFRHALPCLRFI